MGKGSSDIKETPDQKAAADIALERLEYYESDWKPVEADFIREMQSANDAEQYQQIAGDTNISVGQAYDDAAETLQSNMAAAGVRPGSGKHNQALKKLDNSRVVAGADTVNRAQSSQQDSYVEGLGSVVALGEGQAVEAQQGLSEIAARSGDEARSKAASDLRTSQDTMGLASAAAGMAYDNAMADE